MFKHLRIVFVIAILQIISCGILAQNDSQKKWLFDYSNKITEQWKIFRSEAESLAVIYKMPIYKVFDDGRIMELQRFENNFPVYDITDNINAAATLSTRYVWPDGFGGFTLTGLGQKLGLWEAGGTPLFSHQEYAGRVTQMDGGGNTSEHASHVAGTMIATGINPNAKGMAYLSTIDSYTSNNDLGEISSAAANGLKVSNHSYGLIEGWTSNYFSDGRWAWFGDPSISTTEDYSFGYYSSTSNAWDNFLVNAPNILICKSAGNDRGDGPGPNTEHWVFSGGWVLSNTTRERDGGNDGFDCINDPKGIAKNTLTVGAVQDIPNGYLSPSDVIISSFSNWGPTDDGRIKPDIVANGVGLNSASNSSITGYANLSGTSMSTPNVSGSVALILQQQSELYGTGNPFLSSTLKALIIHTADEAGISYGPDYIFGWGLMNTYNAIRVMKLDHEVGSNVLIKQIDLTNGNFFEFPVQSNGTAPLRVTICWTDPGGAPPPISLNPTNIMLVNDLDVRVTDPSSSIHLPWTLNPASPSAIALPGDNIRDNVEQIDFHTPIAGTYTIRVSHKGQLTNGSQKLSLIITGGVISVPEIITLTEPSNGVQNLFPSVLFKWQRSPRSMNYQIQIADDSTFFTTLYDNYIDGTNIFVEDLPGMSTLFWRVRSLNSGGSGPWSEVRYFTTTLSIPATPLLIIPPEGAQHQEHDLNFEWNPSTFASNYRIQIANNTIFTSLVVNDSTLTTHSYTANQLAEGKKLYWRVNAKNSSGTSDFSSARNFTTKLFKPDSLSGSVNSSDDIELSWIDRSNAETKYFVLRKNSGGSYTIVDSLTSNQQSFIDTSVQLGLEYSYAVYCKNTIASSDTSNEFVISLVNISDELLETPFEFVLEQNYPNPFNPTTQIKYGIPSTSQVRISVYNVIGEFVSEIVNNIQTAGYYTIEYDASALSSGIYFYKIDAVSEDGVKYFSKTFKMILLR